MTTRKRAPEDVLTDQFADLLRGDLSLLRAFVSEFAPESAEAPHITLERIDRPPAKADLLIRSGLSPVLYVEAKLEAALQPSQVLRARAFMVAEHGSALRPRSPVLLLSCEIPCLDRSGWPEDRLFQGIRLVTWRGLRELLVLSCPKSAESSSWKSFWAWAEAQGALRERRKDHSPMQDFGKVLWQFASIQSDVRFDIAWGGRIDPYLQFGYRRWKQSFGDMNVERLRLFFGSNDALQPNENFRAQLIVWHTSDFPGSRDRILARWSEWTKACGQNPNVTLEIGGRQHTNRQRGLKQVELATLKLAKTCILNAPGRLLWTRARTLSSTELMSSINRLVAPFVSIVDRLS